MAGLRWVLLKGALVAEKMVGLKMNVPKDKLEDIVAQLPALTSPTISNLYNSDWVAVESVVDESIVREIIPRLIEHGADGVIEYSLNKMVNSSDRFL